MSKQLELMAASYADRDRAATVLTMIQQMHSAGKITLVDAALVTKDQDGKVHIQETREVSAKKGALRGALVTGVLGVIYPPSLIATVLVGGAAGGLWGKLRDTGIKTGKLKEITEALEPAHGAVVVLVEAGSAPLVARNMTEAGGTVMQQSLDSTAAAAIEQASATDAPKEADEPEQGTPDQNAAG